LAAGLTLSLHKRLDILVVGSLTLDQIFQVTRLPERNFEAEVIDSGTFFGGRAPNVAAMAAKLGLRTGIVSAVGDDFRSSGYERHLGKLRVDLSGVTVVPGQKTRQTLIFSDPEGNQITFLNFRPEKYSGQMEVPVGMIRKSKVVHLSSSGDYRFNVRCASSARQNGALVSFDIGNDPFTEIPEYLKGMIKHTSFLFGNDAEVSGVLDRLKVASVEGLLNFGPPMLTVVVIEKKSRSSVIYSREEVEHVPSAIRNMKDPSGGSDGYVAGFLTGYLGGHDWRTAGILGAVEASFIVEKMGCQTNLPDRNQLVTRSRELFGLSL